MDKVGIGVIGLGNTGLANVRIAKRHPRCSFVAGADLLPERVERAKAEFGLDWGSTDYHDLLAREDVHIVCVNTPDHLHAEPFVDALKAGKHVFVEKPMADNIEDLRKMVEAASEADTKTLVGHILRFNPLIREVKRLIGEGELGQVFYMEADYIHDLRCQADPERFNPAIGMNWWLQREHPMIGGGCHQIDYLRWFIEDNVAEVQAYSNHMAFPEMKEDDCNVAILRFKGGCIAKVAAVYGPVGPRPAADKLAVYGTKATIMGEMICRDEKEGFVPLGVSWRSGHPFDPQLDHFIRCVLDGEKPITDARDGANSAAAAICAALAAKTGGPVRVPEF